MTKAASFALVSSLMFLCSRQLGSVALQVSRTRVATYTGGFQRSAHSSWQWTRSTAAFGSNHGSPTAPFHSSRLLSRRTGRNRHSRGHIYGFRHRLAAHRDDILLQYENVTEGKTPDSSSRSLVQDTFSVLARKGRTWRRLRHLVDLACSDIGYGEEGLDVRTIADVGCDHGLLAIGLAVSGQFEKVIGTDVSERALKDGAISFHKEFLTLLKADDQVESLTELQEEYLNLLPVEFRVGDGLESLKPGESDVVCIAGMGVNTMLKILCHQQGSNEKSEGEDELVIDRLKCRKLLLQPTNSKPRNLLLLYDRLQSLGWYATEERIEKLSSRWYISVCFVRKPRSKKSNCTEMGSDNKNHSLPGQKLAKLEESDPMKEIYYEYVQHHIAWLQKDLQKRGSLNERDSRWLEEAEELT